MEAKPREDMGEKEFGNFGSVDFFCTGAINYPLHEAIVTVEDPPISFSPFSSTDCTMLSHFSFNDFIAVAFPDLARDLDTQL